MLGLTPFLEHLRGWHCLHYHIGMQTWLEGRQKAAFKQWHASAEAAQKLAMPWEEVNTLREIGKRSEGETRREYLQNALILFTSSHASYDMLDTKKVIGKINAEHTKKLYVPRIPYAICRMDFSTLSARPQPAPNKTKQFSEKYEGYHS
ncbi:MAG: hypothetical protein Q8L41_05515 [Anaerolineales bacterium]|nr:hypothetical protein [Anaerolineales bacterium]